MLLHLRTYVRYDGFMGVHEVRRARAAVADVTLDALDDVELDALVHEVADLRRAVDRLWLGVAAQVAARSLHTRHHERDPACWLARVAGERIGATRRDVELGAVLATSPELAEASAAARLSKAQTAELSRAADLPSEVLQEMAADATQQSVHELASAVRRARFANGAGEPVVEPSCHVLRRHDRVHLEATLDLVDGELVEVALDAYADTAQLSKELPYPQRRAAALTGLARYFLDHAGDPATTRVGRPHVLVLVDLEVLERRAPGSATLGSGAVISAAQAAQLAADASISRVITDGASQVLDVGRSVRSVPPAIAKAVIARDRHCRFRGCTSPPWACEIHHLVPWAKGGPTSLQNLGLVCWHHHKLVHAGDPARLRPDLDGRWTLDAPTREAAA
jgi:hypothetical protein